MEICARESIEVFQELGSRSTYSDVRSRRDLLFVINRIAVQNRCCRFCLQRGSLLSCVAVFKLETGTNLKLSLAPNLVVMYKPDQNAGTDSVEILRK